MADAFVCTANIEASDGGAEIVAGNRKVLAARLSDARFFWEQDRKVRLQDHAKKLERITFHEKLGTVADKVERVAKLARWLVEQGIVGGSSPARGGGSRAAADGGDSPFVATPRNSETPLHHPADGPPPRAGEELADLAEQAARLCKADLVTEMVGEFPELQGLMGGYYASAEGLDPQVAEAIRDHYKPVGQGDEVPTAPVTVAVSLADKLDTLSGFFKLNDKPTGSKDPFALRRAALGVLSILEDCNLRVRLLPLLDEHLVTLARSIPGAVISATARRVGFSGSHDTVSFDLLDFFADRLKVQQREAGVRHDLIDAVFALGGEDDLVRLLARVHALQAFVGTPDGANLLAGYKRAANILKKENFESPSVRVERSRDTSATDERVSTSLDTNGSGFVADKQNLLSHTPEPAERALIEALDAAEPKARDSVATEDFAAAMSALASLRSPIDAFFDNVTVNDPDERKRAHRLSLLARFRSAVHQVADFSKIEG